MDDKTLPVVILTYCRPQYLQRTISTFIGQNRSNLDMFSFRILVQGGLDQGTSDVLEEWESYFDFVDIKDRNMGIGQGYSVCMKEALSLNTPYLLHLQDDWESKEPLSRYLPEIFDLMNTDRTIGYTRLRTNHDKVSRKNVISNLPIKWEKESENILVSNAHFTLNPTIIRRDVVERMIPIKKERHAQEKYHELGLRTAQLVANCFCHIGHKRMGGWKR